jgi:hypothetical protein
MRTYESIIANNLSDRSGLYVRHLLWIRAKNRDTLATETIGLWDGDDHAEFTIDSVVRQYYGAGTLLAVPDLTARAGLEVWQPEVSVSGIAPEVEIALRGYEPKLAPVEIHRAFFHPDQGTLLGSPVRIFKGWIDGVSIPTPEEGGDATASITLASNSRGLTRVIPAKKSDEAYQRRSGDRIMRYADIGGTVKVRWGT